MTDKDLEQLAVNVVRGLAMDAPQQANSGHPGTAMALAPLAHVLFTRVLRHDPSAPDWPDRDRFILSAGHASILLYSMLYLSGYGLTLQDLKDFRQWGSATPGHPEVHHTPGVEVTTGPLGQGFANAVGMGIAERWLRARFGPEVADHHTYVICSDGDLQEGLSHEAASLAGHLALGRLIYVYDDNHITIDGSTELAYSDDVPQRFESYGWHVDNLGEVANDLDTLEDALRRAAAVEDRPSLIILRSHIGYPSPNLTDTAKAHGSPFGEDEIRATKAVLGLPIDESFWVPEEVIEFYRMTIERGREKRRSWQSELADWNGDREALFAALGGRGLTGWSSKLPTWTPGESVATRVALQHCLNAVIEVVPGLNAGGADLTGNTGTELSPTEQQTKEHPEGRRMAYGIREHAMGAIMNGMAMHGGLLPVGGTFFNFSDYMRGAIRLAALSEAHVVYAFTHDSVGLGEDGPTHQPIEQLATCRATPGLRTIRPADANETAHAVRIAVDGNGPTALILSRQNLPVLEGTAEAFEGVKRGAYVIADVGDEPDLIVVATGSEVHVAIAGADQLAAQGIFARVVSMPCWKTFEDQGPEYQEQILPSVVPTLSVEAASTFGWSRWADEHIGIDRFGASAPGNVVLDKLGFSAQNVAAQARNLLEALEENET